MHMLKRVASFFRKDDGAVTVDWVVLCAGLVAMAAAIAMAMEDGTLELTGDVETFITDQAPK